jgi:hypothetical protein
MKATNVLSYTILTAFLLLLTACGRQSDKNVLETPIVTYQPLQTTMTVNEGGAVILTLNVAGEGAEQLKFDWQVDGEIYFSGQGTDSISFIAPSVDSFTTINVQVKLDSAHNSSLINFSDQYTLVSVANIETIAEANGILQDVDLPKVTSLNFEELIEGSSWFHEKIAFNKKINITGDKVTVKTKKQSLIHIEATNVSTAELTLSQCGLTGTYDIDLANYEANIACSSANSTLHIQQAGKKFRVERRCDDKIIMASIYTKQSNDRLISNSKFSTALESYDDINITTQVCGMLVTDEVKTYDSNDNLSITETASVIRLFTNYQGNPFELKFQIDEFPTKGFATLNTGFLNDNVAKIYTNVLPEISDLPKSQFGSITFDLNNSMKNIKAQFDFSVTSTEGQREAIKGEFKLFFE